MSNLKDNIKSLIAKALKNPSDQAESDQLDQWLKESEENIKHLQSYNELWDASEGIHNYRSFDSEKSWEELNKQISPAKSFSIRPLLKVAAVALVILSAGFLLKPFLTNHGKTLDTGEIAYDAPDFNQNHTLNDNSEIWLSKDSKLTQDSDFTKERIVSLKGQAFFDVQHDPSRKFVVRSGKETITVLGTEFNVINEDNQFEVFVKSGRVEVNTGKRKIELKANDWLIKDKGDYIVGTKPAVEFIDWVGTKFNFDNVALTDVFRDISKAYGIKVVIDPAVDISNCKITTNITDESISEVFEELKLIAGLEYTFKGNNYTVNSVNCK